MPRYRFTVEYLGTPYAGWQIQPGEKTVQGDLEAALRVALKVEVPITGSGRTDAGVHSAGQVAHFDYPGPLDCRRLQKSLNALGGRQLSVRELMICPDEFHARYSALTRRYRYRLALRPTPLFAPISWCIGPDLQAERVGEELAATLGERDFVGFCVPRGDGKSTLCRVMRADIAYEEAFLCVHIEANRFLHKMVRALVGAAVDVARGRQPPGLIAGVLSGEKGRKWTWAPPHGLCLEKVTYPDDVG